MISSEDKDAIINPQINEDEYDTMTENVITSHNQSLKRILDQYETNVSQYRKKLKNY
jgi:hypothetical protein